MRISQFYLYIPRSAENNALHTVFATQILRAYVFEGSSELKMGLTHQVPSPALGQLPKEKAEVCSRGSPCRAVCWVLTPGSCHFRGLLSFQNLVLPKCQGSRLFLDPQGGTRSMATQVRREMPRKVHLQAQGTEGTRGGPRAPAAPPAPVPTPLSPTHSPPFPFV